MQSYAVLGEQPCEQPSKKLGNPHKCLISETEQGEQPEQPHFS